MSKEIMIVVNLFFACFNAVAMYANNSLFSAAAFGFSLAVAFILAIAK